MVSLTLTGSGTIGDIQPGWTVTEQATPNVLGYTSGSVGMASFSAGSTRTSRFIADNPVEITSGAGTFRGRVSSATEQGMTVSASVVGRLEFLVSDQSLDLQRNVALSFAIESYIEACDETMGGLTFSYTAASDPTVNFPAWSGNVWAKLKELCVCYGLEIAVVGTEIVVRDLGSLSFTIPNTTPVRVVPQIPSRQGVAIAIVCNNASNISSGIVWDSNDRDEVFQIDVAEVREVLVNTDNSVLTIFGENSSFPYLIYSNFNTPLAGQYSMVDSTGANVPKTDMPGGPPFIYMTLVGSNTIRLRLAGPPTEAVGFPGPYRYLNALGQPTLSVQGTGVGIDFETVDLLTGAAVGTPESAFTFSSPFMNTRTQAYDRGVWAAAAVAAPTTQVTFSCATADLPGFGLTAGARFEHEGAKYRVTSVTFGALRSDVTAEIHTTIGDIDELWAGLTLGDYDGYWSGYSLGDQAVQPLRYPSDVLYPSTELYPSTDLFPAFGD